MSPFLQTLCAFLLGGLVSLGIQFTLELRREQAELDRVQALAKTETRMAARLVLLDLISMLPLLESSQQTGRWLSSLELPVDQWGTHCALLSRSLEDTTWRTLGATFSGAESWNRLVRGARRYYWVMPSVPLRWFGLTEMRDELTRATARSIAELLPQATPTSDSDDPLLHSAERVLSASPKKSS
jgi:hypothetical protein